MRLVPALLLTVCCSYGVALAQTAPQAPPGAPLELPEVPRDNLPEEALQRLEGLESEVEAAATARPEDPVGLAAAYGEIGGFYFLYDFLDAAEIAWEAAAVLQPQEFRWHYLLGAMLRLKGDFQAAVSRLERALAIRGDDVPALIRLARIRTDRGELVSARRLFERVLELAPDTPAAHYGLGSIAVLEERWEDALVALRQALTGQPEGSTVHHQLGLAYRGLGDLELARSHLERNRGVRVAFDDPLIEGLVDMARGPRVLARSGIQAQRAGSLDAARELLREAARLDPDDAWIRYNLGVVYEELGDIDAARREFQRSVELDPDYRNAQYNLAQLLVEVGDLEGAVEHFARAREIDPEDHLAWLDMAVALSRLGQTQLARDELEALVAAAPTLVDAKLNLATLLAQLGRSGEARVRLDEVLTGDATPQERAAAHLIYGRLVEATDAAAAVEHYRRSTELDTASGEARRALAMALGRQGRFAEAAAQFEVLVERRPDDAELRLGQTMALLLGEDYGGALTALEAATTRLPKAAELAHTLARLLATCPDDAVRDGGRALELSRHVLEQSPTLEHAETVGMALAELGRFEEAVSWQRNVIEQQRLQGAPPRSVARSRRYLELYTAERAVRAPWLGGGGV